MQGEGRLYATAVVDYEVSNEIEMAAASVCSAIFPKKRFDYIRAVSNKIKDPAIQLQFCRVTWDVNPRLCMQTKYPSRKSRKYAVIIFMLTFVYEGKFCMYFFLVKLSRQNPPCFNVYVGASVVSTR